MVSNNSSKHIISHVSIGTNDCDKAIAFYDNVMKTLGVKKLMEFPGTAAYGKEELEFWVQKPHNNEEATVGNGFHIAFCAESIEQVKEFYRVALENGAKGDGEPGPRPEYGKEYYACFVRDLDGNKIEAFFWNA